jgi:hypothetical protein
LSRFATTVDSVKRYEHVDCSKWRKGLDFKVL